MKKIALLILFIVQALSVVCCADSDRIATSYTICDSPYKLEIVKKHHQIGLFLLVDGSCRDKLWVNRNVDHLKFYFSDSLVYVFGAPDSLFDKEDHQYLKMGEVASPSIALYNAVMNSYNSGKTLAVYPRCLSISSNHIYDIDKRRIRVSCDTTHIPYAFSDTVKVRPVFGDEGDDGFINWMIAEINISEIEDEWKVYPYHYYSFVINEEGLATDIDDKCSSYQRALNSSNKTDKLITSIISRSPRWIPGSIDGQHACKTRIYIQIHYDRANPDKPISISILR